MHTPGETPDPRERARARSRHRLWLIGALAVTSLALLFWMLNRPEPDPETQPDPNALPELSKSSFRNTRAGVAYVGSAACTECHPDEHASFRRTGMGRSTAHIDLKAAPPDGAFDHEVSKRRYQVYRKDGQLRHRETLLPGGSKEVVLNDVAVKYAVGSGNHAQTFLTETDGFLVESPITWYESRRAWGMSPGYDRAEHGGFQRGVGESCLFCHTGKSEALDRSFHRMRVDEPAISCERCHGPGELHVQRHTPRGTRKTGGDDTIVNPARLPRELAEAVCQQCHLQASAAVPARGRKPTDYRPGLPLEEFRHDYRLVRSDVPLKVVGHAEQLRLSKCYQRSAMTCLTCHDPHHEPEPKQRDQHYQIICLSCHKPAECSVDARRRAQESPENRCVQCHMPRAATEVAHVAFTHHRIAKQFQPEDAEAGGATPAELQSVLKLPPLSEVDRRRSLGLGYLEAAHRAREPVVVRQYERRALELLGAVRSAGLRDPLVDAGLASLASLQEPEAVVVRADDALADLALPGRERCEVLFNRAQALARQGEFGEASRSARELTRLRRHATDWLMLADFERALENEIGRLEALDNAVRINPRLWKVQRFLGEHYRRLGSAEKAAWHEARSAP